MLTIISTPLPSAEFNQLGKMLKNWRYSNHFLTNKTLCDDILWICLLQESEQIILKLDGSAPRDRF